MPYVHFQMKVLPPVLNLITSGCYLAKIDLKDVFYLVPMHTDYTKYLKFLRKGQLYIYIFGPS